MGIIPGGGGGVLGIYIGGGMPKNGDLRCGHSPKSGVLGAATAPKKGGRRCVYNTKNGEFRIGFEKKRLTGTEISQKGVLGAYLFLLRYFYFYFSTWSTGGGCSGRLKKGVLGADQVKKGVFTAAHTYTEHICEGDNTQKK